MAKKVQDSQFITLINPPQGKSTADDYAERANQWAEKNMKTTVSAIERKKHNTAVKMGKEQSNIVKEFEKMKKVGKNQKSSQKKVGVSNFLQQEKARLHHAMENAPSDEYRSDGNSSDNYSEISFDEEDSSPSPNEVDSEVRSPHIMAGRSVQSSKRRPVATYEERSRDQRITNLQRRYSAQVRTNPIVNVNRRLKYSK